MSDIDAPRHPLVECEVTGHRHYGLVVRTVAGDRPGYVDASAISDELFTPADLWPSMGRVLTCVVVGGRRDGRLNLSCRPRDVELARSVADVREALAEWRTIRDEVRVGGRLPEFMRSPDAVAVLRWALRRPADSPDHLGASELLADAPVGLARAVRG
jgi:hypothetical protein